MQCYLFSGGGFVFYVTRRSNVVNKRRRQRQFRARPLLLRLSNIANLTIARPLFANLFFLIRPRLIRPRLYTSEINTHPPCGPSWVAPTPSHAPC